MPSCLITTSGSLRGLPILVFLLTAFSTEYDRLQGRLLQDCMPQAIPLQR